MSTFILCQFSSLSFSLESMDDCSDSGSDFEVTMNATKRKKQALPKPRVRDFILSWNYSLLFRWRLFTREQIRPMISSNYYWFYGVESIYPLEIIIVETSFRYFKRKGLAVTEMKSTDLNSNSVVDVWFKLAPYLVMATTNSVDYINSLWIPCWAALLSLFHPKPPKRPRRKTALRTTSNPSRSPSPTPPDPSLQRQQNSRGTSRLASPRPVTRVNGGNQGISAEDIYDAVRSGKSAMVVSKPSTEKRGRKGVGGVEINAWREGGTDGDMSKKKINKPVRADNKRDYHVAVSGWLMWPYRIAFDMRRGRRAFIGSRNQWLAACVHPNYCCAVQAQSLLAKNKTEKTIWITIEDGKCCE